MPERFLASSTMVAWSDICSHVRSRAEVHRKDLLLSRAAVEGPYDGARRRWIERTSPSIDGQAPLKETLCRSVDRLMFVSRYLLQADGRQMVLKVDREEPGREILRWRFVSLAIPSSILVAAAGVSVGTPPASVRILHSSIAPDKPVAHQHVHHAAMMSFEELWVTVRQRALFQPGEFKSSLRLERAFCPGLHWGPCLGGRKIVERASGERHPAARARHMETWTSLLYQAFVAGCLLDSHEGHAEPLNCCKDGHCEELRTRLRAFISGRSEAHSATVIRHPWSEELLGVGRKHRSAKGLTLYLDEDDGRAAWTGRETLGEMRCLARAFSHVRLNPSEGRDEVYEALLLQYLRVKVALFRLLVHPPGERGLERFLDHFQQIKVYAPEADMTKPPTPNEPGLRVHATEYRVAPEAWFHTFRLRSGEIEEQSRGDDQGESAWLVHFKRTRSSDGLPLFGGAIQGMESEADDIMRALDAKPTLLRSLRGIDICGVEEHQPLWVSADTLRRVRLHSRRIAGRRPSLQLEPLRLTFHVGEDFRSLTSGMRAVAEPFYWGLIERGDRIGHGLALTLEPKDWFFRHRGEVLFVKRLDRLLDLAFLSEYARDPNVMQRKWLLQQIAGTVTSLGFECEATVGKLSKNKIVDTTEKFWKALGDHSTRRLLKSDSYNGCSRHERWIHRYLWNRSVRERAEDRLRIPIPDDEFNRADRDNSVVVENLRHERDLLISAHRTLLQEVARWQVCIESNPSSNLVVGSLDGIAAQDFLARRPTKEFQKEGATLTWTINTDDPITFSTTLADEYAYAWAGMTMRVQNPCDPSYARALLDEAAATSMRTRFTVQVDGGPGRRGIRGRVPNT